MDEYVKRSDVINSVCQFCKDQHKDELCTEWDICQIFTRIANVPPADVIDRNEGIKMGAELAAMHGSDATSQELEKAYFKGVEEGYKRIQTMYDKLIKWLREEAKFPYNDNRDWFTKAADTIEELQKRKHGKWEWDHHNGYSYCSCCNSVSPHEDQYGEYCDTPNYCPNCGADMRDENE